MTMLKNPSAKYRPFPQIELPNRQWPGRTINQAPRWLSTDLRDGNQSLIDPMGAEKKNRFLDLLIGIGAGITAKLIIQLALGVPIRYVFRQPIRVIQQGDEHLLEVEGAATFSNLLNLKKHLNSVPAGSRLRVNFAKARYVDHTVQENLHHFQRDFEANGGKFILEGIDRLKPLSKHPLAARRNKNDDLIQRT